MDGNVASNGGDIANIINKYGLDSNDLIIIIDTLFKNNPKPQQLRVAIKQFQIYQNTLWEWKELHNDLDDILLKFDPFDLEIKRVERDKRLPQLDYLKNVWGKVCLSVDVLMDFSTRIQYIGKCYEESSQGIKLGEPWAIKINALRLQIDHKLEVGSRFSEERATNILDHLFQRSRQRIKRSQQRITRIDGDSHGWWQGLPELTSQFHDVSTHHLHLADKRLRESADKLYVHSKLMFGN